MANEKNAVSKKEIKVSISAPNIQTAVLRIVGETPLVMHRFWKKTELEREYATQKSKSKSKNKDPRNYEQEYLAARHVSEDGWVGFPVAAFRNAAVAACRLCGYQMVKAKLSIFVEADGLDDLDAAPLVKLDAGDPECHIAAVRNSDLSPGIRARPMWRDWAFNLRVSYDGDQFTVQDVVNLFARVGRQVGIGEGRPSSSKSCGLGWGLFRIDGVTLYKPEESK